ncbi:rho guanine nucleotide exchange factor 2-like isoform X8 [Sinocyclocheilus grahami]|uniref:Rho guanine nucleotide exchange factor 2-like n=1 Tax=Sinocyclocheilus grahami TaxID=75366 RepID=A0A672R8N7_SINGR|nr:PREDICTED: rho guanine nucleotide exchange factor 2-like isoform X4 [Sinocyclocheilus grahami]XP_016106315.1 PREDICTED: rho guanine nucleotide exchange factor 2-like isoform X8 [Sinocyclocheilus grahami]
MGPEELPDLMDTMSSTPPPSPRPVCSSFSPPHCSPPVVTLRSSATRYLTQLDPWRRHSWEPGAVAQGYPPNDTRSVSLEDLNPDEMSLVLNSAWRSKRAREARRSVTQASLTSLTEEEVGAEHQEHHRSALEEQSNQMHGCSVSAPSLCMMQQMPRSSAPRPRSYCHESFSYNQIGGSSHSIDSEFAAPGWDIDRGQIKAEGHENKEDTSGNRLERTLSFLRKMTPKSKNKEKERMREREREARDREARYTNGHLFNSLTVSGTTLCSACNKSITAKEALSCPTCNVTIHNRCRDTLPNCVKMKQKQQKMALMRNNSAYQNVTLRNKAHLKDRPSSAIYPSDSLRQSLLGSRRGRSSLLLSKSVSTNNIAGTLNDDSPLGLRRILSQSTDSLNFRSRAMSMESLNDEGEGYFTSLLDDLEYESREFEADSWSMAVDSTYLQTHRKDVIKRQDVIYELIQTELHHVRTLRIMDGVFRRGMLEEVQLELGVVHALFPCLERLLTLHTHFLTQLLERRAQSLQPDSTNNFTITQISDLLIQQFSGQSADEMLKAYSEFCSRHMKTVKLYKELLARDKRLQLFIRRVSRGPLLRRHGFQECILLVTQRITKYPVLLQRICDNTKDNPEEAAGLSQALSCIRELLCSVDLQVLELERTQRLQEIRSRVDPRAEAKLRSGALFRPAELLRRQLIHEGTLLWKTPSSRLKDVQVMLMTDILVFLQEKDQRFIFASLDKSAVVSLQSLLVRDIANQERGLFLISSESSPPEMYELYAASKDDRNTWIRLIQQTISSCPSREEFPLIETEDKALLRRLRADIQQKDREVLELLQERVTLFSDLAEVMGGYEVMLPSCSRNLFRAESPQAPHGEQLLTQAITEVDRLTELLLGSNFEVPLPCSSNGHHNHTGALVINGQEVLVNGSQENQAAQDGNGNQMEDKTPSEEVSQRLVNLSAQLHALQGVVIRQDSILELCRRESSVSPATAGVRTVRSLSRDGASDVGSLGDLALLQRQHSLLQEELGRLRGAEGKLRDSERARAQLEKQLRDLKTTSTALGDGAGSAGSQAPSTRRESDADPYTDTPLASQESMDQSDGLQECSDVEVDVISDDDEDDEVDSRVSPRSESPRDLQDIPEESESATDPRDREASHC